MMTKIENKRPSPIAGQWYPGNVKQLADEVDNYMDSAKLPEIKGEVVAVMAPHAGYLYSGSVAGYAFATLRGLSPDIVFVLSPMHYPYYEKLMTTSHDAYTTPLGDIPVDHKIIQELNGYLKEEIGITLKEISEDEEHSLEIELPFLQRALKKPFSLIPIMLRDQSEHTSYGLAHSILKTIKESNLIVDKSILLVASTDLSHFFPHKTAIKLDSELLQRVERFDPVGVIRIEDEGKGYACGRGALAAVMWIAKDLGADKATVLKHATSGDTSGEYERVVGYGAAVITRSN